MPGAVRLSISIGPVPIPAPEFLVDALTFVKVEAGSGESQTGFELTFELPARSPLKTLFLLTQGKIYKREVNATGITSAPAGK